MMKADIQKQEMTVNVEVKEEDVVAFHQHQFKTSPQHKKTLWTGLLSWPLLIFVLTFIYSDFSFAATLWFALPFTLIFVPLVFFYQRRTINATGRKMKEGGANQGLFCWHTYTISPNGLNEKTDVNESVSDWKGLEKIDETETHIFIYIGTNNAHVIPKRYFSTAAEANEFVNLAKIYFQASKA